MSSKMNLSVFVLTLTKMEFKVETVYRNSKGFIVEGFIFNKVSKSPNKDGSFRVRCNQFHARNSSCKVVGKIVAGKFEYSGGLTKENHNHPCCYVISYICYICIFVL